MPPPRLLCASAPHFRPPRSRMSVVNSSRPKKAAQPSAVAVVRRCRIEARREGAAHRLDIAGPCRLEED